MKMRNQEIVLEECSGCLYYLQLPDFMGSYCRLDPDKPGFATDDRERELPEEKDHVQEVPSWCWLRPENGGPLVVTLRIQEGK